jgi:4-amino-4-deoxy-L-arabinose transferase-like glycosyltransferase
VLWTVFAVALAASLGQLVYLGREAGVEEHLHENWVIAHNLVTGNGYLLSGRFPTAHKPPVYPFFLALMIRLFGDQPFLAIRIVQSFIFAAGAAVAYALFRHLVSGRVALLAAVLVILSPFLRKVHLWIDSVSMSVAGILIVLLLAIQAQRDPARTGRFVLLGVAAGLLALTLPATLGFVPVIGVWLFFQLPPTGRFWKCILYVVTVILCLVPWTVRNAIVFGRLIPVSSNLKLEFWIGNNPEATGGMQNVRRESLTEPRGALAKRLAGLGDLDRNDALGREAWHFIRENPGRFLVLRIKALFYFFCSQSYWLEDDHTLNRVLAKTLVLVQAVLAAAGCALALRRHLPYAGILAGCLAAFTSVYVLTHADIGDRYRLPIDPLLILFSVYALSVFWQWSVPLRIARRG